MPFTRSSSRLVRTGAQVALSCQYVYDPDTGTVAHSVNGVFQATTTKADGTDPMPLITGRDGVPALYDLLTEAEKAQLSAICDKVLSQIATRFGLTIADGG